MSSLTIAEVVEQLKVAKTKTERLSILKDNDSIALRGILRMNFDSALQLSLPEGVPPFKKNTNPQGFGNTTLKASAKGWYVFVKDLSPLLKQSKRESIFISLLQDLDAKEADILLQAKDRKLDLGLTRAVVNEAFPGLIQASETKNGSKKESNKNTSSTDQGDGQGI